MTQIVQSFSCHGSAMKFGVENKHQVYIINYFEKSIGQGN